MDLSLENFLQMNLKERQLLTLEICQFLKPKFDLSEIPSDRNLLPTFVHCKTGLEFKYIFGGEFNMGFSEEEEKAAKKICDPIPANLHEMRPVISTMVESFLISRFPVFNGLFWKMFSLKNQDNKLSNYPAYLTRNEANKLTKKIGGRLPYEKEWEYACRSMTKTLFNFGNDLPEDEELVRWLYNDFSDLKKLAANLFGLYGMFIGEWCNDEYRLNYDKNSPKEEGSYVIRGGGAIFWPWQDEEWVWCMSAMRMPSTGLIDGKCGLRLVFDVDF